MATTSVEFKFWMDRLSIDKKEAADVLGVSERTIDGWIWSSVRQIPRWVPVMCEYTFKDRLTRGVI